MNDLDLNEQEEKTLRKLNIDDIKCDETLQYVSSGYDSNDGVIRDGLPQKGPILITFSGVLKYDVFPLAKILREILTIGQNGMGCPVEIEFAVDFDPDNKNPPFFSILQIRPLVLSQEQIEIAWDEKELQKENILVHSKRALGNGVIDTIKDVIYVPPSSFLASKTIMIADEIGRINKKLSQNSPYVLIGPGRWGTQDRWLGIPVRWSQISNVKVMIETALKQFNIKPSQGTHFLQNIISRGISYINITLNQQNSYIDWKWLDDQPAKHEYDFVRHIELSTPLTVKLDGRSGNALILKPQKQK